MPVARNGRSSSGDSPHPSHSQPAKPPRDPPSRATTPRDAAQALTNLARKHSDSTLGADTRDLAPPGRHLQQHIVGTNARINTERVRAGYLPLAGQDRYVPGRREEGDRTELKLPVGYHEAREGTDEGERSLPLLGKDDTEWPSLVHDPPSSAAQQHDVWGDDHSTNYGQSAQHRAPFHRRNPTPAPSDHRHPPAPALVFDGTPRQHEAAGGGFMGPPPGHGMIRNGSIRSQGVNQIVPAKHRTWGQGPPVEDTLSALARTSGRSEPNGGGCSPSVHAHHLAEPDPPPSRAQPSPQVQAQMPDFQEVDDREWGESTVQPPKVPTPQPRGQPLQHVVPHDDGGWGDDTTQRHRPPKSPSPHPPPTVKPPRAHTPLGPAPNGGDWEDKNGQVKRWAASVPPVVPDPPLSPRCLPQDSDAESLHRSHLGENANNFVAAVTAYYSGDEGGDEGGDSNVYETPAADDTPALTACSASPVVVEEEADPAVDRPRGWTTPKPSARTPRPPVPVQLIPPILATNVNGYQVEARDWGKRRRGRDRDGEVRKDWWRRDPHPMYSPKWADRRLIVVLTFPIKCEFIRNLMYQHFSKYGTVRGAFHYDSMGETCSKAIVVFDEQESIDKVFADPGSKRCLFRSSPHVQATELDLDLFHATSATLERTIYIRVTGARSEEESVSRKPASPPTPQDAPGKDRLDDLSPMHQAVLPLSVCVDRIPFRRNNSAHRSGHVLWSIRVRDRPWPTIVHQSIEKTGMDPRPIAEIPTGPKDSERDFVPRLADYLAEVTNIYPPTALGQGWLISVSGSGDGRHLIGEISKIPGFFARWADERDGLYATDGGSNCYASTTGEESPLTRLQNELKGRSSVAPYVVVAPESGMTPPLPQVECQPGSQWKGQGEMWTPTQTVKESGTKEIAAISAESVQEAVQESVQETSHESIHDSGHEADHEADNETTTESVQGSTKDTSDHTPTVAASMQAASLVATPVATPIPAATVNANPPTPRTPPHQSEFEAIPGKIFNSPNHPHLRRMMMYTYRGRPVKVSTDPETGESRYTDEAAVFVGRLEKSSETEATIFTRFSKYGKIFNIEYHPEMTAPQMNYATARVMYQNRDSASKAIAGENGRVSEGSVLKVELRKVLPMEVMTKMMYIDPIGRAISPSLVSQASPRPLFTPDPTHHEPGPAPHYQASSPHSYVPMMPTATMPPPMPFLHQMGVHMYPQSHPLQHSLHPMHVSMAPFSPSVHGGALPHMPMSPGMSVGLQQSFMGMQGVMGISGGVHYPYNFPIPVMSWGYGYMPPTSHAAIAQPYFVSQQPPLPPFSPPTTMYDHNESASSNAQSTDVATSTAPPSSISPSAAVTSTEPEAIASPEHLSRMGLMMQGLNSNMLKPIGYKEEDGMIKAVFDPKELEDYYVKTGLPPPSEDVASSRPSQREEVVLRERKEPQVTLLPISTGGHDPVPASATHGRQTSLTHPLPPKPTLRRAPSESSLTSCRFQSQTSPPAPAARVPEPQSPGQLSVTREAGYTQQCGQAVNQASSVAGHQPVPHVQMSSASPAVSPGWLGYGSTQRAPVLWIPPNHPIPPQWHETGAPSWYPFPLPPLGQPQTTGLGSTQLHPGYSPAQTAHHHPPGNSPSNAPASAWPLRLPPSMSSSQIQWPTEPVRAITMSRGELKPHKRRAALQPATEGRNGTRRARRR